MKKFALLLMLTLTSVSVFSKEKGPSAACVAIEKRIMQYEKRLERGGTSSQEKHWTKTLVNLEKRYDRSNCSEK